MQLYTRSVKKKNFKLRKKMHGAVRKLKRRRKAD